MGEKFYRLFLQQGSDGGADDAVDVWRRGVRRVQAVFDEAADGDGEVEEEVFRVGARRYFARRFGALYGFAALFVPEFFAFATQFFHDVVIAGVFLLVDDAQDAQALRAGVQGAKEGAEVVRKGFPGVRRGDGGGVFGVQFVELRIGKRREDAVFVVEMAVYRTARHARALGNGVEAGLRIALFVEQVQGGGEDVLPGLLGFGFGAAHGAGWSAVKTRSIAEGSGHIYRPVFIIARLFCPLAVRAGVFLQEGYVYG